ncbi:MAG: VOC family protein [Alphaproteobacteria bacterium]|nr:VOC family protein [Alphaproteobacteria bacterium]
MPALRLEHVNVTVADPEAAAKLMGDIFGWAVRWDGPSMAGGRSIHVGADDYYLALYAPPGGARSYPKGQPLNHIGVEVDDLESIETRVVAAGLRPFNHGDYAPGQRFYFLDPNGIEYEVVSYA